MSRPGHYWYCLLAAIVVRSQRTTSRPVGGGDRGTPTTGQPSRSSGVMEEPTMEDEEHLSQSEGQDRDR